MTTIDCTGIFTKAALTQLDRQTVNRPGYQGKKAATPVKTYTVSFNVNGGTGSMDAFTVKEGSKIAIPTSAFTAPASQTFKGWNSNKGGTGTAYTVGQVIGPINSNTTVYATWQAAGG